MTYPSPRTNGSTPIHDYDFSRMSSATPTPSPRPTWYDPPPQTPRRPSTRAGHSRGQSYSQPAAAFSSPLPPQNSPRYNSSGQYATVDVSYQDSSSRRPSVSIHRSSKRDSPKRDRRHSYTYVRSSPPHGESDEDELFDEMGYAYVVPTQSRPRPKPHKNSHYMPDYDRVWYTNLDPYSQDIPSYYDTSYSRDASYEMPRPIAPARPPTSFSHTRRVSTTAVPPRSSTVRPVSFQQPSAARARRSVVPLNEDEEKAALEKLKKQEAARHKIPAGFSLKNWDYREPPILLLGSVFDANSLGKWIYDWTVHSVGSRQPIAEIAGEMWLLLLELSEKTERAEKIVGNIRSKEKKKLVIEYLDASERLQSTFRLLLKACEAPMLRKQKKTGGLGENAGVEFVNTLFGRDAELNKTEKWMQKVRTWSIRFDTNASPILDKPTA
jgi:hypothetical protein